MPGPSDVPESSSAPGASDHTELLAAIADFVEMACKRLEGEPFPRATIVKWRYDKDGLGTGKNVEVIAPAAFVVGVMNEWQHWPSYKNLASRIENDDLASAYLYTHAGGESASDDARPFILQRTAAQFVYDYWVVAKRASAAWSEDAFNTISSEFIQTINTGRALVDWWAPMYNAHWVDEPIDLDLGDNLRIVEPPNEVLLELQPRHRQSYFEAQVWVQLSAREQLRVPVYPPPTRPARNAAAAVRLAVGGFAFTRDITMLPRRGAPGIFSSFGGWHGLAPQIWGTNPSVVTRESSADVMAACAGLLGLSQTFDVVLDRYEAAVSKWQPEERLIDAVIALEALVLAGNRSTSEVTFRFALTGAWLLGGDLEHRKRAFHVLTELYRKRSDIVHADRKVKRDLPDDPSGIAVDLLRQLLRTVVTQQSSWDEWVELCRSAVLGHEEPTC